MRLSPTSVLLPLLLVIPRSLDDRGIIRKESECIACVFQRPGNLGYILHRAVDPERGPSEDESFGHCYVCLQCEGAILPTCRGWWPEDPAGGDYEGDAGMLQDDRNERWAQASCTGLTREEAAAVAAKIYDYDEQNRYQVLNRGGRSCLGFCEDIAAEAGLEPLLPLGDFTLAGDLGFPGAPVQLRTGGATPLGVMFDMAELSVRYDGMGLSAEGQGQAGP